MVLNNSIHDILLASTVHGLPSIMRSKRLFHKIMWTICTVVSSGVCCWFIYESILKYLDFSVSTNIQNIYEQPAVFPTVSICADDNTLFRNKSLKSLINNCTFNYDDGCFINPGNYFEPFEDDDYNLCYRFNSGKNMTGHPIPLLYSTIGGMDDSLTLSLKTNRGLVIWVHNASTPPKRELRNNHNGDIRFAPSGTLSHLIIDRILDTKLGEPYNQCLKDANEFELNKSLIDYIKAKDQIYKQVNCLELCFDLDYITNNPCNCTNTTIGKVWEKCFINSNQTKIQECTMSYKSRFYRRNLVDNCSAYCPLECDSYSYPVVTTYIDLPNKFEVLVFVYYRTLKYTLISQQPAMIICDLVSNVGGILGLFIGISFLSFIEIFEIITEIIFVLYESSKTNLKILNNS